jgi:hypothetical protein
MLRRVTPTNARRRRGVQGLLLLGLAMVSGVASCCPENYAETCNTTTEWKRSCGTFPAPSAGEQCPSAEAFAIACDNNPRAGSARANADKCCYEFAVACL